jgi:hypothetical protein
METLTVRRVRAAGAGVPRLITYTGAAAFAVAAVWFWLVAKGVTVAAAPQAGPGVTQQQALRIHYRWLATTLPQERLYTSIAMAAFGCLTAATLFLPVLMDRGPALTRTGALTVGGGALLWAAGNVLELGGHHAVGLMATHANPIQTTNAIAFTIDTASDAFDLAAFALIGAGMIAFAAAAANSGHRAWAGGTAIIAATMLVTAAAYTTGNGTFEDVMLLVSGVGVLPAWLIWTGRIRWLPTFSAGAASR